MAEMNFGAVFLCCDVKGVCMLLKDKRPLCVALVALFLSSTN